MIFDEQLQIFKIREVLVNRALRDYMKLDKTNVTITRGECYFFINTLSFILQQHFLLLPPTPHYDSKTVLHAAYCASGYPDF